MRASTVLWVVLAIVGLFGALRFSAVFFGLFTVGLFLIFYDLSTKRGKPQLTVQPSPSRPPTTSIAPSTPTCPNCGMVLKAEAAFCPQCGWKVRKG